MKEVAGRTSTSGGPHVARVFETAALDHIVPTYKTICNIYSLVQTLPIESVCVYHVSSNNSRQLKLSSFIDILDTEIPLIYDKMFCYFY